MNKEYEKLILQFAQEGYKISEEQAKEIYKLQKEHQESLLDLIAKVLLSYTILDSVLKLSTNDRNKLRKEFSNKISSISKDQYKTERSIMESIFEESIKQKYYSNAYVMDIGVNFKLQKLADEEIHKVVSETIKSELWSDRLWSNKKDLEKILKVETERFLQGKTNVNKIEKVVKDRFNQNAFNTHRLVQTEVSKCQTVANEIFAEKHGIKEQMFCATLDLKTSEKCRDYDGKVFDIDDNNKPIPPLHPFCRSCLINVPYKDWKPIERLNNVSKEKISYMDYERWYSENVANNPKALAEEKKIQNKSTDKKQHGKYKEVLGDMIPKSFDKFQELKYNNVNEWETVKDYYKARAGGHISSFSTYSDYKSVKKELSDKIVGIKTVDGIEIKSFSKHMVDRILGTSNDPKTGLPRSGTTVDGVLDALKNPVAITEIKSRKLDKITETSKKYIGETTTVSINPTTGNLIQSNPSDKDTIRRLKEKNEKNN